MADVVLTHELLSQMAARTSAHVPGDGIVFFGIRGALPLDLSGTPFAASHGIRLTSFNHQQMRCALGQWRPASRTLALFPGSTVPNVRAITAARSVGGLGANMLMLGRYKYQRGVHKPGSPSGHRAFRQAMFFPVWRNADDLDFDLNDRVDLGTSNASFVFDNLHCAFHDNVDTPGFSSNGCQVVAGLPMSAARGNRPETGPWRRFVENAYGGDADGQSEFRYLLFSGAEAAMVASRPPEGVSRSLRFGSSGEWVGKVQAALRGEGFNFLTVDEDFGRDTLQAVMAFQKRELGPSTADGVVGANTAAALGVAWPRMMLGAAAPVAPSVSVPAPAPPPSAAVVGSVPPDWQAAATAITPGFEVSGDPYEGVSGDFDGMGISCGALQWNIGKGSLQPMVKAVGEPVVHRTMPSLGDDLWNACNGNIATGLAVVRSWQAGTRLSATARRELQALMGSPEMRAQQDAKIARIAERALEMAARWAGSVGTAPSKRQFLWFFDLATQNGSLGALGRSDVDQFIASNGATNADDVICDFLASQEGSSGHVGDANRNAALWRGQAAGEQLDLLILSYLRSGTAIPRWRHVVLNRKGTIAMGKGWVNSTEHDFSRFGI